MQDAHVAGGPSEKWVSENLRYQWLLNDTADGSLSRRFGIFVMFMGWR